MIDIHALPTALCMLISTLIIEEFISLNGMTLFELSRGWPKIIEVRHAVIYFKIKFTPIYLEWPASSSLLYHVVGVSGWHWE